MTKTLEHVTIIKGGETKVVEASGEQGPAGKNTYELAVANGFSGTLQDYLDAQGIPDQSQINADIGKIQGDITDIEGEVSTIQGDIATLGTDKAEKTLEVNAGKGLRGGGSLGGDVTISQEGVVVTQNSTLEVGVDTFISGDITLSLPSGAIDGDTVRLNKSVNSTPTINGVIVVGSGEVSHITYDEQVAITFTHHLGKWVLV